MKINFKLIFMFLTFCIYFQNAYAKLSAESWESIEKWTDVCVKSAKANDVNSAIEVINALGEVIPYAGPFATILSGILSIFAPNEMQQIKEKLNQMDKKLDAIDRHIGEVITRIESVAIESQYKSQIKYIRDLKDEYLRFIENPTNITHHDFSHKCKDLRAIEFLHYIDREMNNEELLPLRQEMIKDFDIANVNAWSGRIATMLTEASFLHVTCIGASGYSAAVINQTLNGINGQHGDRAIIQGVISRISVGIGKIRSEVGRFFEHAKDDVNNYLSQYTSDSHEHFSERLFSHLSYKYPARDWYVASWWTDKGVNHWMHWTLNANSNYWHKVNGRCLIVAAAPRGLSLSSYAARRDRCLSSYRGSSSATKIEESLESCLGNWELMAVVYRGGFQNRFRGTASNYYTYAYASGYHYHFTTIPSDNSDFYSNVSNQTTLVVSEPEDHTYEEGFEENFDDDVEKFN